MTKPINPDLIWVAHPNYFDDSSEPDEDRVIKKMQLFALLDYSYENNVKIGLSLVDSSEKYRIIDQIRDAYSPLEGRIGLAEFLKNNPNSTVMSVGAHIRFGNIEDSILSSPVELEISSKLEGYQVYGYSDKEGNEYYSIGGCVSNPMRLIDIMNRREKTNVKAVIDTRFCLYTGDPRFLDLEDAQYWLVKDLQPDFLFRKDSIDGIF